MNHIIVDANSYETYAFICLIKTKCGILPNDTTENKYIIKDDYLNDGVIISPDDSLAANDVIM